MQPKKGNKRAPFSEETKQRMREAALRRFSDPAARQAQSELGKKLWKSGFKGTTGKKRSEETRKRMSEAQKRRFADPGAREAHSRLQKALWATPDYQARIAEQKAVWTPERRAMASALAKAISSRGKVKRRQGD